MPTFYYVVVTYKDGHEEVFEGYYNGYSELSRRLSEDPNVLSWTVDWDS